MIVSASRRTDIPRFYLDWLVNRLKAGYALVRNPMNRTSVSRVPLDKETVECIAFWTKNPKPMLSRLNDLEPYPFYVQFTLNAYGPDVESALPPKAELVRTFQELSRAIGAHRTVWRYSPILLSDTYTVSHHLHYFEVFAKRLEGFTTQCRISFLDLYPKIECSMQAKGMRCVPEGEQAVLAKSLCAIGAAHGIEVGGCGSMDLARAGMASRGCIDEGFVERAIGSEVVRSKAVRGRNGCYCMPSVDIGAYDTCANGCVYCYANGGGASNAPRSLDRYDPESEMLCDALGESDTVTDRKARKLVVAQMKLELP
ncbi:DUF1848 domain-containing protein [Raoultibacter phocaeensis]|uniref:DUF1848 domain-containing protein n=1 Tax=Raoultibacter phocaeensis TaxID=2479841 RepID=UPI0011196C75|nr:DUF1848 domain-containing protein [Raoultibacter phocaeensis]